jgi:metal-responsive CopG/Arc/MetJ family transcriptional regulator
MQKVLISIPDSLAHRLRVIIPARQRSRVIAHLIMQEIERREHSLYSCALEVEKDETLNKEMQEWDLTLSDGLDNEPW